MWIYLVTRGDCVKATWMCNAIKWPLIPFIFLALFAKFSAHKIGGLLLFKWRKDLPSRASDSPLRRSCVSRRFLVCSLPNTIALCFLCSHLLLENNWALLLWSSKWTFWEKNTWHLCCYLGYSVSHAWLPFGSLTEGIKWEEDFNFILISWRNSFHSQWSSKYCQ